MWETPRTTRRRTRCNGHWRVVERFGSEARARSRDRPLARLRVRVGGEQRRSERRDSSAEWSCSGREAPRGERRRGAPPAGRWRLGRSSRTRLVAPRWRPPLLTATFHGRESALASRAQLCTYRRRHDRQSVNKRQRKQLREEPLLPNEPRVNTYGASNDSCREHRYRKCA